MTGKRPAAGLRVRLTAMDRWESLSRALTEHVPPCQGRPEWTADDPEQREWAAHHCHPCPVSTKCGQFAVANKEQFGVWAGIDRTKHTREELPA